MPGHLQEGFGCVVTNRFDQLLDDESDPFEILKAAENKKKEGAAAGSAKSAAQAAKQPKKESQKDRKNPLLDKKEESQAPVPLKKEGIRRVGRRPDQQGQPGSQNQGGQGDGRPGDKRPDRRPPRERRFEKPAEDKPEGADNEHNRLISSSLSGVKGHLCFLESLFVVGCEYFSIRLHIIVCVFLCVCSSSQKSEEKRSGSGSHNWGTVKEEVSEAEQTAAPETTPEGEENAPAGSENKENEVEEVKNEGPKEMTLDEWKAMQDKERTKVEFNIRKPNEGADSQWKKGYVLHKSKSEDLGSPDESIDHHFRKPANDITSQLEINFGDLGRPGRGRGGARGGRGGRGGGGGVRNPKIFSVQEKTKKTSRISRLGI
uniref:SERPINE1 mRNA binding protein 1b n=1 Tax=Cyclopterus lumpus TaxID=8103 RepID=A0A8C2Z980_CYCLU